MSYKNLIAETVRLLKAQEATVERDIEALLEFEMDFANVSFVSFSKICNENEMCRLFFFSILFITLLNALYNACNSKSSVVG